MSDPYEDLAVRLTESARAATAALSADEATALRRYQGLDRTYELVSAVLRGLRSPEDLTTEQADLVIDIIDLLTATAERWRIPEPIRLYRGQRSINRVFGTETRIGRILETESFLSTTIYRAVALEEFTSPPGLGGPVLLEIEVAAGTPGLWLPPAGEPTLAYQGELLLPAGRASLYEASTPTVVGSRSMRRRALRVLPRVSCRS